jgi:TatD DNase family protein
MFDIHTHLYMSQYNDDRAETIKRAFDVGLSMMISVSTSPDEHRPALAVTKMDERIFASIGLHPHYFNESLGNTKQLEKDIKELRNLVKDNPKIIAIGECGLDYFSHTDAVITDEQKSWQKEGFIAQIQLAQELGLPMIIHCRDAYENLAEVIDQEGKDTKFILHCYMGDAEVTKKFLILPNIYFSFTGNVTYLVKKNAEGTKDDIRETVKLIPIERMLMETDCPFLAPVPYRGKRNEPSFVVEVAKKIADIKRIPLELVCESMRENRDKIFAFEKDMV